MTEHQCKAYEALCKLQSILVKWKELNKNEGVYQITSNANHSADNIAKKLYFDIQALFDEAKNAIKESIEKL